MILADATWQEVGAWNKNSVILIPTGAIEQHGAHLPLSTDALIVEAIATGVERLHSDSVVLCPTVWFGVSAQHLSFAGSLSASHSSYGSTLAAIIDSFQHHGFNKFYVLNGHGTNSDPNRIALREAKAVSPNNQFVHVAYWDLIVAELSQLLNGPSKEMTHAGEAETSLILHLRPELVRMDKLRSDGLRPEPPISGLITHFNEVSEEGSIGDSSYATAETGAAILSSAIEAISLQLQRFTKPYTMVEI